MDLMLQKKGNLLEKKTIHGVSLPCNLMDDIRDLVATEGTRVTIGVVAAAKVAWWMSERKRRT